jgi:hypothetical protein
MGHWCVKLTLTVGFFVMALFTMEGLVKVTEQRQALASYFRTRTPGSCDVMGLD